MWAGVGACEAGFLAIFSPQLTKIDFLAEIGGGTGSVLNRVRAHTVIWATGGSACKAGYFLALPQFAK